VGLQFGRCFAGSVTRGAVAAESGSTQAHCAEQRERVCCPRYLGGGQSDPHTWPKGDRMATEAYCVKCRAKKMMKDEKAVTMKNGKPATQGICPDCGTKMFKIGKSK
jgi:hypothetical protein